MILNIAIPKYNEILEIQRTNFYKIKIFSVQLRKKYEVQSPVVETAEIVLNFKSGLINGIFKLCTQPVKKSNFP